MKNFLHISVARSHKKNKQSGFTKQARRNLPHLQNRPCFGGFKDYLNHGLWIDYGKNKIG